MTADDLGQLYLQGTTWRKRAELHPDRVRLIMTLVRIVVGDVLFYGAILWAIVHFWPGRRRKRRAEQQRQLRLADEALASHWTYAQAYCAGHPDARLAHVTYIYRWYRYRGVKAIITWYGTGHQQDTWFECAWPPAGAWLVLSGYTSYGPHNQNPDTFYARIVSAVPFGALEAWQRGGMGAQEMTQLQAADASAR